MRIPLSLRPRLGWDSPLHAGVNWRDAVIECVASLAFLFATTWPLFVKSGIPAYSHDWSWPFSRARFGDALPSVFSTWNPEGFGHPNPFASINPANFVPYILGMMFPPKIALLLLLSGVAVVAGLGVAHLCRSLDVSRAGQLCGIAVYLLSPVLYNKTSAGQLGYLVAYALLPLSTSLLIRACDGKGNRPALVAYMLAGMSCITPQFLVFGVFQAIALVVAFRTRRALAVGAGLVLSIALLNVSFLYAVATQFRGFAFTIPFGPVRAFEMLQSASIGDALRLIGYIIPYARLAYERAPFPAMFLDLLWIVPIVACVGLAMRCKDRRVQAVIVVGAFGFLTATGLKGPIAPLFGYAFEHIAATTILRELYHAAALLSIAWAVGIGLVAGRSWKIAIPTAAVLVLSLLPLFLGHDADLNMVSQPAGLGAAVRLLQSRPPARVLPLPYKMPMAFRSSRFSGVDELSFVDANHPSAGEYGDTPELDVLATMNRPDRIDDALSLMGRLGIGGELGRSWLSSSFAKGLLLGDQKPYAKSASRMFGDTLVGAPLACSSGNCVAEVPFQKLLSTASAAVATPAVWRGMASLPTFVDSGSTIAPRIREYAQRLTPRDGWVAASSWLWARREWANTIDILAVTDVASQLDMDAPSPLDLRYASGGVLSVCQRVCIKYPAASKPTLIRLDRGPARISSAGRAALALVPLVAKLPVHLDKGLLEGKRVSPWEARGTLIGTGTMLVVFRDRFDSGWSLSGVPVLAHVRVDAFFNGWLVRNHGRHDVLLYYQPQQGFMLAAALEVALYCALLLCAILSTPLTSSRRGVT